ncbi:cation:dicarboxylate symporter family transporter [Candidatus Paracaedibacter symbiosus]|uniref:cation:dicarboxylate symporter family transporter n=1 Tax=Candidatus Paracaedibacter symbiosus TaxID=244582 RepID=UPI0005095B44|nr:cation:dicarboxylase symporter family transporter [Candidatus Paracaedibacter symbiosus]
MLKSLPVQLVVCVVIALLIGTHLDFSVVQLFFSLSCAIKDILMMILPFVIVTYIASAILSLEQRAPLLLICVMLMVCLSNITAVFSSYCVGQLVLPWLTAGKVIDLTVVQDGITPLFTLPLPKLLEPSHALMIGMGYGLLFSFYKLSQAKDLALNLRDYVTLFLRKGFIPFLPVYVFGFVLKMQAEGSLVTLFTNYGQIFLVVCLLLVVYITFVYALAEGFKPKQFIASIRTMLPAGLTGFSTMSSAASMPVTLTATEQNVQDAGFTQLVIPTTVNIHLLGDALGIPLIGLAILQLGGLPMPGIEEYMIFAAYFCMAKFSTAAIPGGGVLVLLPTLQTHLGLTPEMTGLVATIYILQDSLFTGANVMGNGGFALVCHRLFKMIRLVQSQPAKADEEALAQV